MSGLSDPAPQRVVLDTSAVLALDRLDPGALPGEIAVTAVTLAELSAGPHATDDAAERARRQDRLQLIASVIDALPFDEHAARAYGRVYDATRRAGRKPRGARVVDLLIAAVALANDLPLVTCNPEDAAHLEAVGLEVRALDVQGDAGT